MSKNFCLVSAGNIYNLPYARNYIDAFLGSGNECTLLFWDRDGVSGVADKFDRCEKIVFNSRIGVFDGPTVSKLRGYIQSQKFFNKVLRERNFDGIVFLQTHVAVMCQTVALEKYSRKYIVEIRDFFHDDNLIYRAFEKRVLAKSYANVISSPAYTKFLPCGEYVLAHNYTPFDNETIRAVRNRLEDKRIGISYVGTVRFFDINRRILDVFANDERFVINFFGVNSDVLEQYAAQKKISNAKFIGRFAPSDVANLYMGTDLINNVYGNNTPLLDYALSNKIYHAAQFHMPILVCPGTCMEEIAKQYDFGFVVDKIDSKIPDRLFEWYNRYDREKLALGCDRFIERVKEDNEWYYRMIGEFATKV